MNCVRDYIELEKIRLSRQSCDIDQPGKTDQECLGISSIRYISFVENSFKHEGFGNDQHRVDQHRLFDLQR